MPKCSHSRMTKNKSKGRGEVGYKQFYSLQGLKLSQQHVSPRVHQNENMAYRSVFKVQPLLYTYLFKGDVVSFSGEPCIVSNKMLHLLQPAEGFAAWLLCQLCMRVASTSCLIRMKVTPEYL